MAQQHYQKSANTQHFCQTQFILEVKVHEIGSEMYKLVEQP